MAHPGPQGQWTEHPKPAPDGAGSPQEHSRALGLHREMRMARISGMISPGLKQLLLMVSQFKKEVVLIWKA